MPILCSCFAVGSAIAEKVLGDNPEILERLNVGENSKKLSKIFAKKCRELAETSKKPCGTCQDTKNGNEDSFETYLNTKKQNAQDNPQIIYSITLPSPSKQVA